jgi:hypothetical protein
MQYSKFAYLWPPRPDKAIGSEMLGMVERQGYHAQVKKNGTCNVLAVSPDKDIVAMNRHKEDHKLWTPNVAKLGAFTSLPGTGWYVFVAELLHSKVPGIRDVNYVHDILVQDGNYLVGVTQAERHALLCKLFGTDKLREEYSHWVVDDHTQIAKQFTSGFKALYDSLDRPEDEGLVLKMPTTGLQLCTRQASNNAGMLKSRKAHKNYSF